MVKLTLREVDGHLVSALEHNEGRDSAASSQYIVMRAIQWGLKTEDALLTELVVKWARQMPAPAEDQVVEADEGGVALVQ